MTAVQSASFAPRLAQEVTCGNAVILTGEDKSPRIFMKVERLGKEYVHHYLVALLPTEGETQTLVYIDPEDEIIDCGLQVAFNFSDNASNADNTPNVGDVFTNHTGTFLKLIDDPKTQKHLCFVDLGCGQVRVRQERKLEAVYREWQAEIATENGTIDPLALLEAYING